MNTLIESFIHFWEVMSGVFTDDRSKALRLACFGMLFLGMLWAGVSYFQARRISDTDDFEGVSSFNAGLASSASTSLNKIAAMAQTVSTMRQGGEALAESLNGMHMRLFNLDTELINGEADINMLGYATTPTGGLAITPEGVAIQDGTIPQEAQAPEITVKAVMMSGGSALAVIDTPADKGIIVRNGSYLPDRSARVTRINSSGISIRFNGRNIDYSVK